MQPFFDEQTSLDLEFDVIRTMLAGFCIGPTARNQHENLQALSNLSSIQRELHKTNELHAIRTQYTGFPAFDFEELDGEIRRLAIEGSHLDLEAFVRLVSASKLVNDMCVFFSKHEPAFPELRQVLSAVYFSNDIIKAVEQVIDERMQIRDEASAELKRIRQEIKDCKREINKNFDRVMRKLQRDGFLGDTNEAYINDRRVLTVVSNYKRQVPGNVLGASKTGNLTYIEPRENASLNSEYGMLLDDERAEIRRILLALTKAVRKHLSLVQGYQNVLCEFDFINAKVKLALKMNACMPAVSDEMEMELIDAYHPLLLLSNAERGLITMPQSIRMNKFCRMMVISGPNAGGKSVTLKTVGLLQIMVQCALLVPVEPSSRFAWFQYLLTDIGDNQSIANQLSTYSYRLKRMKYFLDTSNRRTLLLLDEFGTGSDPELGGALAEVFFESLYNKKSFAVITTHYSNIKLKASQLRNAVNASMLFDKSTLKPQYKLSVGQPGSSFTFEVAQINGIPADLIEEAKTRVDAGKVELDALISELQKEKSEVDALNSKARKSIEEAALSQQKFEELSVILQQRQSKQQVLIEQHNKEMTLGAKMSQFVQQYKLKGRNTLLLEEVKKFLAIEKSKLERKKIQSTAEIKPKNKNKNKDHKPEIVIPKKPLEVGDRVSLKNSRQVGQIAELNGKEATVLFGNIKAKVKLSELTLFV